MNARVEPNGNTQSITNKIYYFNFFPASMSGSKIRSITIYPADTSKVRIVSITPAYFNFTGSSW